MSSIKIGNTSWHYLEKGTGQPVVLVHGFPLDHRIWLNQLEGLSDRFRVIAVDLKGFGQSQSAEAFSIDSMADDLAEFLSQINATPCVVAGLSMGGYVAFSLAVRHPELLKGLIIVCSKAEGDARAAKEARQTMADLATTGGAKPVADQMLPRMFCQKTYDARPELAVRLREIMESCPPATIANACFAMRDRINRTPDLPGLEMPVMIVLGQEDVLIPQALGLKMARSCQRGKLAMIPNAGHMAPMEEPAAVNQAIADWVARLD